ncbi:MAG: endonuclease/exonuclease/phosphatase family protein [Balneolaceae bacterium]|nr:endonuclease/exonuclease/phosphatase family protein [Balneolaceae bacterium]
MKPVIGVLTHFRLLWAGLGFVCTTAAQDTLRIMTYNIYHGEDPQSMRKSNLEDIAELIRSVKPDFVALQEVDSLTGRSASLNNGNPQNQVQMLAEMTGMYGYFGKAIDFDGTAGMKRPSCAKTSGCPQGDAADSQRR